MAVRTIKYTEVIQHNEGIRSCKKHSRFWAVPSWVQPAGDLFRTVGEVHALTAVEECRECGFWRARGRRVG